VADSTFQMQTLRSLRFNLASAWSELYMMVSLESSKIFEKNMTGFSNWQNKQQKISLDIKKEKTPQN
jgi:hypothetical protein